jgi:hypothetical protein
MPTSPKATQDLLDELESSKQSRLRAWAVLQRLRTVVSDLGNISIEPSPQKTFDAEGVILERALTRCLHDRDAALKDLADAARRMDRAAFGSQADFAHAHQALLKALDRTAHFVQT